MKDLWILRVKTGCRFSDRTGVESGSIKTNGWESRDGTTRRRSDRNVVTRKAEWDSEEHLRTRLSITHTNRVNKCHVNRNVKQGATECLHPLKTTWTELVTEINQTITSTHASWNLPTLQTTRPMPHLHTTVRPSLSSWKHTYTHREAESYQEQLLWW